MDYVFVGEVEQSFEDIGDEGISFTLIYYAVLSQPGLQVTVATEFGDDVAVAVAGKYFEAFEDVGVVEALEDVDFCVKQFL